MKLVIELMKTRFVTLHPEQKVADAIDIMSLYQLNSIPVIDNDKRLCGLLVKSDITTLIKNSIKRDTDEIWLYTEILHDLLNDELKTIAGIMRFPCLSVSADSSIETALKLVLMHDYPCLPVSDDAGKVIGMFDPIDVVQAVLDEQFLSA